MSEQWVQNACLGIKVDKWKVWKNSLSILSFGDFIQCTRRMFPCWVSKTQEIFLSKDQLDLLFLCFSSVFSNTEQSTKPLTRYKATDETSDSCFLILQEKSRIVCLFSSFNFWSVSRGEAQGLNFPSLGCSEEWLDRFFSLGFYFLTHRWGQPCCKSWQKHLCLHAVLGVVPTLLLAPGNVDKKAERLPRLPLAVE